MQGRPLRDQGSAGGSMGGGGATGTGTPGPGRPWPTPGPFLRALPPVPRFLLVGTLPRPPPRLRVGRGSRPEALGAGHDRGVVLSAPFPVRVPISGRGLPAQAGSITASDSSRIPAGAGVGSTRRPRPRVTRIVAEMAIEAARKE